MSCHRQLAGTGGGTGGKRSGKHGMFYERKKDGGLVGVGENGGGKLKADRLHARVISA